MCILDNLFGTRQAPARRVSNPTDLYIPALGLAGVINLDMNVRLPALRQYFPLNWVEIYNPSTTTLTVRVQSAGGEMFRVEAGSSRTLRMAFTNLIITNIGGFALAANTAILTVQKV